MLWVIAFYILHTMSAFKYLQALFSPWVFDGFSLNPPVAFANGLSPFGFYHCINGCWNAPSVFKDFRFFPTALSIPPSNSLICFLRTQIHCSQTNSLISHLSEKWRFVAIPLLFLQRALNKSPRVHSRWVPRQRVMPKATNEHGFCS